MHVRGIASREEITRYRSVIRSVVEGHQGQPQGRIDDYSKLFTQVTNIWRMSDATREIVFSRRFAELAARLLRVNSVQLYDDAPLFKPADSSRTPRARA